jgi:hypothetical protein
MMDAWIERVEALSVVQCDHRNPASSAAPFVGKRGNNAFDAAGSEAVTNQNQVGAKVRACLRRPSSEKCNGFFAMPLRTYLAHGT